MIVSWIVFGETVGQILCSWFTKHVVVVLAESILYPIEPHTHGFGLYLMYGVIYNAVRFRFICTHGNVLLWMEHLLKCDSD